MNAIWNGLAAAAATGCLVTAVDARAAGQADFYGNLEAPLGLGLGRRPRGQSSRLRSAPTGFIHYLPGGRMAAVISYDGRKPMKGDRLKADDAEKAQAYASFLAYAGTFRVEGDKVIHHVETSAYQNDVGSEQTRFFRRDGRYALPREHPADAGWQAAGLQAGLGPPARPLRHSPHAPLSNQDGHEIMTRTVAITAGVRTAIGGFGGSLAGHTPANSARWSSRRR